MPMRAHTHTHDVVLADAPAGPKKLAEGDMPPNNIGSGVADLTPLLCGKNLAWPKNQPRCNPTWKVGGSEGAGCV